MISNDLEYSVYIVVCNDNSLYTGLSNNVEKRVKNHNSGKGAKYTRARTPVQLVWQMKIGNRSAASKEEYRIKNFQEKKN